jgi:hypothetical protein
MKSKFQLQHIRDPRPRGPAPGPAITDRRGVRLRASRVDDDNINYGDIVLLEEQDRSVMELNRAVAVATANGIG